MKFLIFIIGLVIVLGGGKLLADTDDFTGGVLVIVGFIVLLMSFSLSKRDRCNSGSGASDSSWSHYSDGDSGGCGGGDSGGGCGGD